ncbi:Digeranylgeranylglyceryl phosphate synthase [Madurella mycetomatis]|uniref:Digeranylgeranylglyceryl phosphate synthase n=1 Tax=Madurella mycetomatis TaxID=100816 RepID=A0A175VR49_9PEZI|nr:Digeranylgeranylglyceryl phosphate synthase [Madurella mycetomatis]
MMPSPARALIFSLARWLQILWGFVESDFFTFAVPNTVFGVAGATAGTGNGLVAGPHPFLIDVLKRLPRVFLFNCYSLLLFDLSNQRFPESVAEDGMNKPWRPIPSGKITPDQTRRTILYLVPVVLWLNYILDIWNEGLLVQVLSWCYNDLRGGDEVFRDAIIAVSYGLGNSTSLRLALGPSNSITRRGHAWTALISAVILTTMHIQDLKDQQGDRRRGRKTIPLFLGDGTARFALAIFVPFWSCICVSFWQHTWSGYVLPLGLGSLVSWRVLTKRTAHDDGRTWRLWCFWHSILYLLPLVSRV